MQNGRGIGVYYKLMIVSIEQGHLGDAFWVAWMLTRTQGPHTFYVPINYVMEMSGLLKDFPIEVRPAVSIPPEARNCWIANGRFEHTHGLFYKDQVDVLGFVMEYMNCHCDSEGIPRAFTSRDQMLCTFPKVHAPQKRSGVLVVNAHPMSGQVREFNGWDLDSLISRLCAKHQVICTNNTSINEAHHITAPLEYIASISAASELIVGVATGPLWPCLHSVNKNTPKYVLLNPMRLDYGPDVPIHHGNRVPEIIAQLEGDGWL